MKFQCKICGNENGNRFYTIREMQFGTRDEFVYCECLNCGCLQLTNPPEDLSKYYPKEYFSFQTPSENFLKKKLNICRDRYSFGIRNIIGKILYKKFGEPTYIGWLRNAKVNLHSKILDVGCGTGKLLYRMGNTGFDNLIGVDAFIAGDIQYENGVKIYKKHLNEIEEKFDLVMMHHSLEHLEDQHLIFEKLSSILSAGKFLLIRIPICSSYAWELIKKIGLRLKPRGTFIITQLRV